MYVKGQRFTKCIVVTISQQIQISNHCVLHLKLCHVVLYLSL